MRINRRSFMKWFSTATIGLGAAGGVYSLAEPYRERTKRYTLATAKWPATTAPLTIAAVGDLHVGCPSVSIDRVNTIVQSLNAMDADIIVLLGDFLSSPIPGGTYIEPKVIAEALKPLKARHGVYAVLGNHDWYHDGTGMWMALDAVGIKVLENTSMPLPGTTQPIFIAGLADDQTRTPDIAAALANIPADAPVIMLAHNPANFLEMNERPVVTLSGHTHGGQMAIPFVGAIIVPGRAPLRYAYGHINEGNRDLIVTSGIGTTGLPIRAFACPELMHITLQSA